MVSACSSDPSAFQLHWCAGLNFGQGRWDELVERDVQHLGDGDEVAERGIVCHARGSFAPLEALVTAAAQSGSVGDLILAVTALDPDLLEVPGELAHELGPCRVRRALFYHPSSVIVKPHAIRFTNEANCATNPSR